MQMYVVWCGALCVYMVGYAWLVSNDAEVYFIRIDCYQG